jgi:hypothetical protein
MGLPVGSLRRRHGGRERWKKRSLKGKRKGKHKERQEEVKLKSEHTRTKEKKKDGERRQGGEKMLKTMLCRERKLACVGNFSFSVAEEASEITLTKFRPDGQKET